MNQKVLAGIAISVLLVVVFAAPVRAKVLITPDGSIILQKSIVLGENSGSGSSGDDSDSDNSGSDDSDDSSNDSFDDSSGSGSSGTSDEEKRIEEAKKAAEKALKKTEQKLELEDGTKIENRIEANKSRFILKKDGRKIRIDTRDGQTRLRVESKSEDEGEIETEHEIEQEQEIEVEPGVASTNTRLRVLRNKAVIERLRARAITSASLSVDPETNTLSITTPRGDVKIVVLPDAAIARLLENNIVDEIVSEPSDAETEGSEEEKDTVRLETEENIPVYKIAGIRRLKFLGVLPFESKVEATVSAETGEVLENNQRFFKRFLGFFSTSAK